MRIWSLTSGDSNHTLEWYGWTITNHEDITLLFLEMLISLGRLFIDDCTTD